MNTTEIDDLVDDLDYQDYDSREIDLDDIDFMAELQRRLGN